MSRLVVAICAIWIGTIGVAEDVRKTTAHEVVRVTPLNATRPKEVSVAINVTNPDHVVAVAMQRGIANDPALTNYAYSSTDGGLTWSTAKTPNPDQRIQADDAVASMPDGRFIHTYISFTGLLRKRPIRASNGIFASTSIDGVQWQQPVPVIDHVNTLEPFEDKPYVAVDISDNSPHRENIYVAWTQFDSYGSKKKEDESHILFSRSQDGGRTFSPPWRVSDEPGDAIDDDNTLEGCVPSVGPSGEVYLAWAGPRGIEFDMSTDGGWTFGKDKVIAENSGGWEIPIAGIYRHNGLPVTGTDISDGPNKGSVYVAWIDSRNDDPDVFVTVSRDKGRRWSKPLRVNDDDVGNGKEQFFAWMSVDPKDGSVNIAFYDRRELIGTQTGLTLARSVDGGRTFNNHRIDQEPFACNSKVFFGDYLGISAFDGRVVIAYVHFVGHRELGVSAGCFRFKRGSQEASDR